MNDRGPLFYLLSLVCGALAFSDLSPSLQSSFGLLDIGGSLPLLLLGFSQCSLALCVSILAGICLLCSKILRGKIVCLQSSSQCSLTLLLEIEGCEICLVLDEIIVISFDDRKGLGRLGNFLNLLNLLRFCRTASARAATGPILHRTDHMRIGTQDSGQLCFAHVVDLSARVLMVERLVDQGLELLAPALVVASLPRSRHLVELLLTVACQRWHAAIQSCRNMCAEVGVAVRRHIDLRVVSPHRTSNEKGDEHDAQFDNRSIHNVPHFPDWKKKIPGVIKSLDRSIVCQLSIYSW